MSVVHQGIPYLIPLPSGFRRIPFHRINFYYYSTIFSLLEPFFPFSGQISRPHHLAAATATCTAPIRSRNARSCSTRRDSATINYCSCFFFLVSPKYSTAKIPEKKAAISFRPLFSPVLGREDSGTCSSVITSGTDVIASDGPGASGAGSGVISVTGTLLPPPPPLEPFP